MPRFSPRPTGGRKRKVDRPTEVVILPPPKYLSKEERDAWRRLAPAACAMGTLVPETIAGFVLLAETVAARARAARILDTEGLVIEGAPHPLLTHFRQLGQRAESLMGKYALTAPGRAVQRPAAKPPSRWDGILSRHPREDDTSPHDFYGDRPQSHSRRPRRATPPTPIDTLAEVADAHAKGDASEEDLLNEILRTQ